MLVLSSEAFDWPVEVTGHLSADVIIASSAADPGLSVRIGDVYPDGRNLDQLKQ